GSGGANGILTVINHDGGISTAISVTAVKQVQFEAGGSGGITIGGRLGTVGPTTIIQLTVDSTGNIIQTAATNVLSANSVVLKTNTGSISNGFVGLAVATPTLQASSTAGAGLVNVADSSATGVSVTNSGAG